VEWDPSLVSDPWAKAAQEEKAKLAKQKKDQKESGWDGHKQKQKEEHHKKIRQNLPTTSSPFEELFVPVDLFQFRIVELVKFDESQSNACSP